MELADPSRMMKLSSIRALLPFPCLLVFLLLTMQPRLARAGVGTAARESPPYTHSPAPSPLAHPLAVQSDLSRIYVGTAAHYSPSKTTKTACYGKYPAQFPSRNMFAAAGEGIWNKGAVCGRIFRVQCTSASVSGTCIPKQTILVRIVDRALTSSSRPSLNGAAIVLSTTTFGRIAKPTTIAINVEYRQT